MSLTATVCLAMAVYYESRNQNDLEYQYMVVDSVMNRFWDGSSEFGNGSICGVVEKGYAKGRWKMIEPSPQNKDDKFAWKQAKAIAHAKIDGFSPNIAPDVLWYYAKDTKEPYWVNADYICYGGIVGDHIWYKECEDKK